MAEEEISTTEGEMNSANLAKVQIPLDPARSSILQAAKAYDDIKTEVASLRDQLHSAVAGLEAKNSEIAELRRTLETQRTEFSRLITEVHASVDVANKARDQAYTERSDALAWLSNIELIIERARDGGALTPFRKPRNGKPQPAPTTMLSESGPVSVEGGGGA
jgi:chromosome segregation ATPase